MNMPAELAPKSPAYRAYVWGVAVSVLIVVGGLYYVKWNPYYHRAFVAAANHSIGDSIVSGKSAAPPAPSLAAAWSYSLAYGKAIWQAMVLGLLLAAAVQTLLPRQWIGRALGKMTFSSVAIAGLASVFSMM